MPLPTISGEFRIGTEPRVGYTPNGGVAFWNARCVMSARTEEPKGSGNWVDDKNKTLWINLNVYRNVAQNMIDSQFKKGDLITVTNAPIWLRQYTDGGVQKISVEVEAKEVGASLTFRQYPHHDKKAPAQEQGQQQAAPPTDGNPVDTPEWATAGSESRQYGWGNEQGGGL